MSEQGTVWPTVLSFAGAMAACGLAMYFVSKMSEGPIEEVEEEEDLLQGIEEDEEDYDLAMDFPQPEMDFNFNLDEEDIGDEELSMSMVRSLTAEQSSDENSQTENNTIGNNLSWTQTQEEVMLEFHIPSHIKAKDIQCKFNTNSISVVVEKENLLEGTLHMPIQPDGCSWEIDGSGSGRLLLVSLLKAPFCPGFWSEVTK